jgi:hypothetical protein
VERASRTSEKMDQEELPEIIWNTKLYFDYFYERPISLAFYTFLLLVLGFTRIFGDATVVILKMKKFKHLSGLEIITTLLIAVDIFYEIAEESLFIETFYHEFHSTTNCNVIHYAYRNIKNFVRTLTVVVVVLAKFHARITRRNSFIVIALSLVISLSVSWYYRMNSDGTPHHICYPETKHWEEYFELKSKIVTVLFSVVIFIFAIFTLLWRRSSDENQNRDTLQYGVTLAGIFCIITVTYILRRIMNLGWGADYAITVVNKIFLSSNSYAYFYFHRVFLREACISLKLLDSQIHERLQEIEPE